MLDMDLGWHRWRHEEHVRLKGVDAPERTDPARWTEAKAFIEHLLPPGTEVLLVSENVEKYGRTLGRILLRDGRDVGLLKAELATPYTGGPRNREKLGLVDPTTLPRRTVQLGGIGPA